MKKLLFLILMLFLSPLTSKAQLMACRGFIEDGYDWANDKIHITSATVEAVTALIGKIQIGDVVVDESLWDITSDGGSGVYVNLVSVPEPAAWAAIFGVAALALAAFRRRK